MTKLDVPSMSQSLIYGMLYVCRCWMQTNVGSVKQSDDLVSTRDLIIISGSLSEVRESVSESGFERADVLSTRGFT